jgi:hypothetical protein
MEEHIQPSPSNQKDNKSLLPARSSERLYMISSESSSPPSVGEKKILLLGAQLADLLAARAPGQFDGLQLPQQLRLLSLQLRHPSHLVPAPSPHRAFYIVWAGCLRETML